MSSAVPDRSSDPQPFRVSDALAQGVGAGRLRGADLERPFHGIRIPVGVETTPEHAYAPLLRTGDRFSHTSAARLWAAPLPGWVGPTVHVTASPGTVRPRGKGVHGHEGGGVTAALREGLPVSDPPTMFLELATLLRLEELVAVGDHLIHRPRIPQPGDTRPHLDRDELCEWLDHSTARGVARARAAAALLRPGVESPRETRLRLLLLGTGMPEPVCGLEIGDEFGPIGWFDLVWPDWKVAAEYDGDQHRTSDAQYERDIRRFDRAAAAGWSVVRVRKHGLAAGRSETIARVASALRRGGCPDVFPNRRKPLVQTLR